LKLIDTAWDSKFTEEEAAMYIATLYYSGLVRERYSDDARALAVRISSTGQADFGAGKISMQRLTAFMAAVEKASTDGRGREAPAVAPASKKEIQPAPPILDRSGLKWRMVPEDIHPGTLLLIGTKRQVELKQSTFGLMLIMAKINGWSGGAQFFDIVGDQGTLRKLRDGIKVYAADAIELGVKYYDFAQQHAKGGNRGDLDAELLRLCTEGGFSVNLHRSARSE
jgi:hypothetical protein